MLSGTSAGRDAIGPTRTMAPSERTPQASWPSVGRVAQSTPPGLSQLDHSMAPNSCGVPPARIKSPAAPLRKASATAASFRLDLVEGVAQALVTHTLSGGAWLDSPAPGAGPKPGGRSAC